MPNQKEKVLIIVPASENNNKNIIKLFKNTTEPQQEFFRYKRKPKIGYYIPEEYVLTIINTMLDSSDYGSTKIYEKDKNKLYHELSPKQLRVLVKRTNHVIDAKLKKTIRDIKRNNETTQFPKYILEFTMVNNTEELPLKYNIDQRLLKHGLKVEDLVELALNPLFICPIGSIKNWSLYESDDMGNTHPVNRKMINKIISSRVSQKDIRSKLKNLKMK